MTIKIGSGRSFVEWFGGAKRLTVVVCLAILLISVLLGYELPNMVYEIIQWILVGYIGVSGAKNITQAARKDVKK